MKNISLPFVKKIEIPNSRLERVNSLIEGKQRPKNFSITRKTGALLTSLTFEASNEVSADFTQNLLREIYELLGAVSVVQRKIQEVTLDLDYFPTVELKRTPELSKVSEDFAIYQPIFILIGWYGLDGKFHATKDSKIKDLPSGVKKVTFLLITTGDTESLVAKNLIEKMIGIL